MHKNRGCVGYVRDEQLPSYVGIIMSHEIRIPIKQPVFQWISYPAGFFERGSSRYRISIEDPMG